MMWNWNDGSDYLMHHGIKGQKWGIRRFQNLDGSLTAEGKERYLVGDSNRPHSRDKKVGTGSVTVSKGAKAFKSSVGSGSRSRSSNSSGTRGSYGRSYSSSSLGAGGYDPYYWAKNPENMEWLQKFVDSYLDSYYADLMTHPASELYRKAGLLNVKKFDEIFGKAVAAYGVYLRSPIDSKYREVLADLYKSEAAKADKRALARLMRATGRGSGANMYVSVN